MSRKNPYSKRNPFTVPEGYFQQLERNVLRRIDMDLQANHTVGNETLDLPHPKRHPVKTRLRRKLFPFIGVAASIAVFAVVAQIQLKQTHEKGETEPFENMISKDYTEQGEESVYDYLLLDNETIYEYATEE